MLAPTPKVWPSTRKGGSRAARSARGRARPVRVGGGQEHGELVAAQPRHRVRGAHGRDEAAGHVPEQLVARVVAERVVDLLEVVQVEEEEGQGGTDARGDAQGLLQAVAEQGAIGQVGQRVVQGLVAQRVGLLARGHVALHRDPVGDVAGGVGHGHDAELDPERAAVLTVVEHLDDHRLPALQCRAQRVERGAIGAGALQQAGGAPQDLGGGVAGGAREGVVDVDDARPRQIERPGLGDQDRVVGVDDDRLQQAQALLGLLPRGDVDEAHHDVDGRSRRCGRP